MANLTDPKVLIVALTLGALTAAGAGGYVVAREVMNALPAAEQVTEAPAEAPTTTLRADHAPARSTLAEFERIKAEQRRLDRATAEAASAQTTAELEALQRERERLEAARRALEEEQRRTQSSQASANAPQTPRVAFDSAPTYGAANLASGFTPDPHNVSLQSGGAVDATSVATGCVGYIASAPDVRLNFTAGNHGLPLILAVASDADTTLVIYGPDDRWYCNDDSNGIDPALRFDYPQSGSYYIWVGTYGQTTYFAATLRITEAQ